jgi:hypothetical protein
MKTSIAVLFLTLLQTELLSQWTNDPENPQLVSNTTCVQFDVQSVSDGNGGAYLFWKDSRVTGCNSSPDYDIYGQHYDSDGVAQWEDSGREIWSSHSHVIQFQVVRDELSGEMVIGALTNINSFYDSLWIQKITPQGELEWENDLLIASGDQCSQPLYTLGVSSFRMMKDDSGYVVSLEMIYCGGSNGNRITRFDINGNLTGPYNGSAEGNQYYFGSPGLDRTYDGTNDIYLFYSNGNGMGAHASCMRVGFDGDSIWAPLDVLDGTNGLNYGFKGLSDENGVAFLFASNGNNGTNADLFMRKLNPDGTWAWNGGTTVVCEAENIQGNFDWKQDDNYYYVCWADARPGVIGNYALYAQKIDKSTGGALWGENGLIILDQSTYLPYPKLQILNDGNILFVNESTNTENGFNAVLLAPDGNQLWDEPVSMATPFLSPFYEDYQIITSDDGVIVAWSKDDGVYIANPFSALVTEITETVSACDSYELNGTTYTESGTYTIELPGDTLLTLELTINNVEANIVLTDFTLSTENTGLLFWINCDDNSVVADDTNEFTPNVSGNYALTVSENGCSDTSECVYVDIIGVEEQGTIALDVYPNPFSDQFVLVNAETMYSEIQIVDISGKCIFKTRLTDSYSIMRPTLPNGVYFLSMLNGHKKETIRIVKVD